MTTHDIMVTVRTVKAQEDERCPVCDGIGAWYRDGALARDGSTRCLYCRVPVSETPDRTYWQVLGKA